MDLCIFDFNNFGYLIYMIKLFFFCFCGLFCLNLFCFRRISICISIFVNIVICDVINIGEIFVSFGCFCFGI